MGVVSTRHSVCSADDREGPAMKLFRYRQAPLNGLLGSTVVSVGSSASWAFPRWKRE